MVSFHAWALPDNDFQNRCNAAGVVLCNGFDSQTDAPHGGSNFGSYPPYGTMNFANINIDTAQMRSGTGSISMTQPANVAGSDSTGYFTSWFGLGQSFGQTSHFYVQYAVRISPEYASNTTQWQANMGETMWKFSIIHQKDASCSQIELTSVNYLWATNLRPNLFPTMYTGCGTPALYTGWNTGSMTADGVWNPSYPVSDESLLAVQQSASNTSGYNCLGGNLVSGTGNGHDCLNWNDHKNEWLTFYYDVQIGTWGQQNSVVKAYVAFGGGPYRQWINVADFRLNHNGNANSDGYDTITLAPYQTGLTVAANSSATIWYDELIISTAPIAAPGAPASDTLKPSPPTGLTAL